MSLASSWGWGERVRAEQPRINLDEYVSGFGDIGAALNVLCLRTGWVGVKDSKGRDSDLFFEDVVKAIPEGLIQEMLLDDKDTIRIKRRDIISLVELAINELKDIPRQERPKHSRRIAIKVADRFLQRSEGVVKGSKTNNHWAGKLQEQAPEAPLGDGELDLGGWPIKEKLESYKKWAEDIDFSGKSLHR